ncbi:MAG: hypothetical protein AB1391_01445 [Candidatus Micrarchaeota archaeon]
MRLEISPNNEINRKILHIFSGVILLIFLLVFGRTAFMVLLILMLIAGAMIINMLFIGWKFLFSDWFIRNFERPEIKFPGYSTAWYLAGLLIATSVLHSQNEIAAVICALAFGDGFSTLFGARGKIKLFYNTNKTLEGVGIFAAATISAIIFIGWIAIPFAIIIAILESIPLKIDDNFSVPVFGTIFFSLM